MQILRYTFMAILSFLMISTLSVHSQTNQLESIYSGGWVESPYWSADSKYFVFKDSSYSGIGEGVESEDWFEFDVETLSLIQVNQWPLLPILSNLENELFSPAYHRTQTFIFESSSNRYLIYAGQMITGINYSTWAVNLADREKQEVIETQGTVPIPFNETDLFVVYWSNDGSHFVYATTAFGGFELSQVFYGSNYAENVANLNLLQVEVNLNENPLYIQEPYGIAYDGSQILLSALNFSDDKKRIIVWSPSSSVILDNLDGDQVVGANFTHQSTERIFVVDNRGLILYNIITGSSYVLDESITSEWVIKAVFSPDGHWVALIEELDNRTGNVYMVNILDLVASILPNKIDECVTNDELHTKLNEFLNNQNIGEFVSQLEEADESSISLECEDELIEMANLLIETETE